MRQAILFAIFALTLVAAFSGSAALLPPVYLLALAFFVGRWWGGKALSSVRFERKMNPRAFLNETVRVEFAIRNVSRVPVVWLHVLDRVPIEIRSEPFRQVVTLLPFQQRAFAFNITATRRGLYQIGPLSASAGDALGIGAERRREELSQSLTIYPRIVALARARLPSHSPLGNLKHTAPIYEDPSRLRGKRDYVNGDSLRGVDWKATATVGRLQVKQFEPSMALETMIFLDLDSSQYGRAWIDASELAIVVAASLGNWAMEQHGAVGLVTNGLDPIITAGADEPAILARRPIQPFPPVSPRKGRANFMRVLDVLARVRVVPPVAKNERHDGPAEFAALVRRERVALSWGATMIVVTGVAEDGLFDEMFQALRMGVSVVLVLCGDAADTGALRRAAHFHIPAFHVARERDLEAWNTM